MAQYQMYRGTTFVLRTTFFRGLDARGNRRPIDLTGAKIYFTAKKAFTEADPGEIQISSPANITIVAPATAGTVVIAVPAANTVGYPSTPVRLYYDITVIEADGTVSKPELGEIVVNPASTNAIA